MMMPSHVVFGSSHVSNSTNRLMSFNIPNCLSNAQNQEIMEYNAQETINTLQISFI